MLTGNQIRDLFLNYFKQKHNHTIVVHLCPDTTDSFTHYCGHVAVYALIFRFGGTPV